MKVDERRLKVEGSNQGADEIQPKICGLGYSRHEKREVFPTESLCIRNLYSKGVGNCL